MKTEEDRRTDPEYRKLVALPCGSRANGGTRRTATLIVFTSSSTKHSRRYVSFATKDTLVRVNREDAELLMRALNQYFEDGDANDNDASN